MDLKLCTKCGENKPHSAFSKKSAQPDGLRTRCRQCEKARKRSYYQQNAERAREWQKQYYQTHIEARRRYTHTYRNRDRQHIRELDRAWRIKNPDKLAAKQNRYDARKRLLPQQLTLEQWQWLLDQTNHCCVYCGKHESEIGRLQQEHVIPLSRRGAYTITNIVPACRPCNSRKKDRTPAEAGMTFAIEINPLAHMKQTSLFGDDAK
jgi:5-methylcytosine-specific restriction endonuclease McrA